MNQRESVDAFERARGGQHTPSVTSDGFRSRNNENSAYAFTGSKYTVSDRFVKPTRILVCSGYESVKGVLYQAAPLVKVTIQVHCSSKCGATAVIMRPDRPVVYGAALILSEVIKLTKLIAVLTFALASATASPQNSKQFAEDRIKAPELREVTEWINSKPLLLEKLKGRVVVLHFFTYG